jgi:zinc transport system substrate-binding protein
MSRKASVVAALTLTAALLSSGCAAFTDSADPIPADGGKLSVVTAFYPLQFIAEEIGGTHVEVTNLTRPGQEPHDLELTPVQSGRVALAQVVVYEKDLQAAVDAAVAQANGTLVEAGAIAGLEPLDHHGHDEIEADEHGEEHDGHDHGELDPHFWQDPLKVAKVADAIATTFAEEDADHADEFRANAAALDEELTALDASYSSGLARCERDTIVVSHNAFGYLTRYGLEIAPIAGLSPDAEPTPADLGRLQQLIEDEGITTVFGERLVSPALTETLADDMGITTAVLDPIEGLSDETSDEDYLSLMESNLVALKKANGCA